MCGVAGLVSYSWHTHRAFSLPWDFRKFLSLCCDRNATSSSLVLQERSSGEKGKEEEVRSINERENTFPEDCLGIKWQADNIHE